MSYFHNDPDRRVTGLLSLFVGVSVIVAINSAADMYFDFLKAWFTLLR